jgi:hypothetical protein
MLKKTGVIIAVMSTILVSCSLLMNPGYNDRYLQSSSSSSSISSPSWKTVGSPGFSAGTASYVSLAVNSGTPYVAFCDGGNSGYATVMYYNGSEWINTGLNPTGGSPDYYTSLAFYEGTPTVVYGDGPSKEPSCQYYNGSSWIYIGGYHFYPNANNTYFSLAFDQEGYPYVAFCDGNGDLKVLSNNSSSVWDISTGDITSSAVNYTSIAFDPYLPYVAFQDNSVNDFKACVMRDNSGWSPYGNMDFSAGQANYITLKIYNGSPYVSYQDVYNGSKATVMYWNGLTWVPLGTPGFSAGQASYVSMDIDNNGRVYVAFADSSANGKVTVMYYNGSAWVTLGTPGFSAGTASYVSLAVCNGVPYVAYQDSAYNKIVVMTYK